MGTRRQQRVNARIVQEVSSAILHLKDPKIGFVTISAAEVSADMRHAKVMVSVLGTPEQQEISLNAIKKSVGNIRYALGQNIEMKFTPMLHFFLDNTYEIADNMSNLIREARESDPNLPQKEDAEDSPEDSIDESEDSDEDAAE